MMTDRTTAQVFTTLIGPGGNARPGSRALVCGPFNRWSDRLVPGLYGGLVIVLIVCAQAGVLDRNNLLTPLMCALLLIFGLPHGTLDVRLIVKQYRMSWGQMARVLVLYLALIGATYGLWLINPAIALAGFLGLSTMHFADDWRTTHSRFLAFLCACALLTLPMVLHRHDLIALFSNLAPLHPGARPDAGLALPDLMLMIAPVALCGGLVAVALQWQHLDHAGALITVVTLAAMVFLPPLVGFAAFFCLIHSPRHLGEGLQAACLGPVNNRFAVWLGTIVPLSALSLGLAVVLYLVHPADAVSSRAVVATFTTLSILTVPHMLVPRIIAWNHQRTAQSRAGVDGYPT